MLRDLKLFVGAQPNFGLKKGVWASNNTPGRIEINLADDIIKQCADDIIREGKKKLAHGMYVQGVWCVRGRCMKGRSKLVGILGFCFAMPIFFGLQKILTQQ